MLPAKKYQDELSHIKKNVKESYGYFKDNCDTFHEFRKFFFQTTISETEKDVLDALGKPVIEFNIGEAYISRLIGEWSKQEPSIEVGSDEGEQVNPGIIKVVEDHLRHELRESNNDGMEQEVYKDLLTGGFSAMKIYTDYENPMSFKQDIKFRRVFDPTLCGWDPVSVLPHKGDGKYCFEIYPKRKDDLMQEYPNVNWNEVRFNSKDIYRTSFEDFNWSYKTERGEHVVILCEYFKKKTKSVKIVQLSNGQTMEEDEYKDRIEKWNVAGIIAQPPIIIKARKTVKDIICRYVLVENTILEYEETDYPSLPIVFVDGNSILIKDKNTNEIKQVTRPYLYNLKGLQKLKNFAGQTLANELENMIQHKFKVAKESLPQEEDFLRAYTDIQKASTLVYNAFKDDNPEAPVPPPQEIVRAPIPPEVMNTFSACDQMTQIILGSYDAALGVNDNQLSGIAIVESATNSNSAAMPYVTGFLQGLNQIAQMYVKMMPKYFVTPMSLPVVGVDGEKRALFINQNGQKTFDYDEHSLQVKVEAGLNFAIQKSRALQQIISLCQASPMFSQFFNTVGLKVLIDNLEIRGSDQLMQMADQYMKQQQMMQQQQMQMAQQQQQNNPLILKTQLEKMKLSQKAQQDMAENQLRSQELKIDMADVQNDSMRILLDAQAAKDETVTQMDKANAERLSKAADIALKMHDQKHRHTKESIELSHDIMTSLHSMRNENNQQGVNANA